MLVDRKSTTLLTQAPTLGVVWTTSSEKITESIPENENFIRANHFGAPAVQLGGRQHPNTLNRANYGN